MIFEEAKKIISWIRYKPNFSIEFFPWGYYGSDYMFRIVMTVPDRQTQKTIDVRTIEYLTEEALNSFKPEDFIAKIRSILHRMETHEVDEWLSFKGQRIYDPHLVNK